jgi:hypothetical protein
MTPRMQRVFAWAGPVLMVGFLIGFLIAHFVPPPRADWDSRQLSEFFTTHAQSIRIGMSIAGFAAPLVVPWSVAISMQLKRIGPKHSGYAYTELMCATLLVVVTEVPIVMWEAIAYRPSIGPAITLRLNDVASLMFFSVVASTILEALVLGIAILDDPRDQPVFPRWIGYFSIGICLPFVLGALAVFYTTGPLAWNGVIGWWGVLGLFGSWVVVISYGLLMAISSEEQEAVA